MSRILMVGFVAVAALGAYAERINQERDIISSLSSEAASAISSHNSVIESAQSADSVAASLIQSIDSSIISSVFAELTRTRPVDTVTTISGHELTLVSTTGTQMLTMTTPVEGEITNIGGTAYVFATQISAGESSHEKAANALPLAIGYFVVFLSLALGAWSVI